MDAGDIAVAAAGSGEDQEVARLRPARQHDLAGAVQDGALARTGREEDHQVAALGAQSQGLAGRQAHRPHAPRKGAQGPIAQL